MRGGVAAACHGGYIGDEFFRSVCVEILVGRPAGCGAAFRQELKPTESHMSNDPDIPDTKALPRRTRFVLVNGRTPCTDAHCVLCGTKIAHGYVRQPQTRALYCDAQCFGGHEALAIAALDRRTRRVS
jgi:hypothetical protein